jgi:hypothetical protein
MQAYREVRLLYSFWTLALDGGETGRMVWWLMDKKLRKMGAKGKRFESKLKMCLSICAQRRTRYETPQSEDAGAGPLRRLNPKPPRYEASVLTSRQQCSVHTKMGKHRPNPINKSQSARTLWSSWQINTPRSAELKTIRLWCCYEPETALQTGSSTSAASHALLFVLRREVLYCRNTDIQTDRYTTDILNEHLQA